MLPLRTSPTANTRGNVVSRKCGARASGHPAVARSAGVPQRPLGIRASNWVVHHGFALNVDCDLAAFARFRACGLDATPFTSIAQELGRDVTTEEARGPVLDALAAVFSLELSAVPS